jgi:hypothetical protein
MSCPNSYFFFFLFSYNILISGTNVRKRLGSHHDRKKLYRTATNSSGLWKPINYTTKQRFKLDLKDH